MENSFDTLASSWDKDPGRIPQIEKVAEIIERELKFSPDDSILDYGCGTGLLGFRLLKNAGHATFCDVSKGMLEQVTLKSEEYGKAKVSVLNADFSEKAPEGESFDKIFTMKVLHHVENVPKLLKNFNKKLKPGGWLCSIDLEKEDGSYHHHEGVPHKGFERTEFEDLLKDAGFTPAHYSNEIVIEKEREGVVKKFRLFVSLAKK